jgi:hypothetical protein
MKKTTIIAALFLTGTLTYAQTGRVGVNTDTPKTTMDVTGKVGSDGKSLPTDITGLQAPRLTREELTNKGNTLYGEPQKGALIYITDVSAGDAASQRVNITSIGYYYFDGSVWIKIASPTTDTSIYTVDGNVTGTTASNPVRTLRLNGNAMTFTGTQERTYWSPTGVLSQNNIQTTGGLATFAMNGGGNTQLSFQQFRGAAAQIFASLATTDLVIGTNANTNSAPIKFVTSAGSNALGTEKVRITGEGRMGVGVTSPQATIHVVKSTSDITPAIIAGCNEYTDNAAATAAGVPVGGLYRTGDVLKIRH